MWTQMTKHLIASFSRWVPSRSCTKPSSTWANCNADRYQHIDSPFPHSSGRTPASPLRTILFLQFPTVCMGVGINFQLGPKDSIESYWKNPQCKTASAHRGRIQHQRWSLPLISAIPGVTQAELKARIPRSAEPGSLWQLTPVGTGHYMCLRWTYCHIFGWEVLYLVLNSHLGDPVSPLTDLTFRTRNRLASIHYMILLTIFQFLSHFYKLLGHSRAALEVTEKTIHIFLYKFVQKTISWKRNCDEIQINISTASWAAVRIPGNGLSPSPV